MRKIEALVVLQQVGGHYAEPFQENFKSNLKAKVQLSALKKSKLSFSLSFDAVEFEFEVVLKIFLVQVRLLHEIQKNIIHIFKSHSDNCNILVAMSCKF